MLAPALVALFPAHLQAVLERYAEALDACGFDALVIDAGEPGVHFLDDTHPTWRANPHFRQFVPLADAAGSTLLLRPGAVPVLLHLCPDDFWHVPPRPPEGDWTRHFRIRSVPDAAARDREITAGLSGSAAPARIGAAPAPGPWAVNPAALLAQLDYRRAGKTAYEIACLRAANRRAAKGHRAAEAAFRSGASEFAIHLAYLDATEHEESELPYASIIAQDRHGAVLHYQHRERAVPAGGARSFLIDAGADVAGYAADITRTHARDPGPFADLILAVDRMQQDLVARIRPGMAWPALHHEAHLALGRVLRDSGLARGEPEDLVEDGVTRAFLPHGLGHLLGLQVHDVGGNLADPEGTTCPPPAAYPALRLTRVIETDWVVTVEPGLYFIPGLLATLRSESGGQRVAWAMVDALAPFGGIRIEDDIHVTDSGAENLTRPAFEEGCTP
jgi:Xaa-Pro dipeptidase